MTPNEFRRALRSRVVWSTFVKLASLELLDVLASTRLDSIVVDLEHSQLDEGEARRLVRHATAVGLPTVVRVPSVDAGLINRLLESGALGIQLSGVETMDQTRSLVEATRYPPSGRRSVSSAQPAAGYGSRTPADLVREDDGFPVLIGQFETRPGPLLSTMMDDLDVAFIGTTDLAVNLGQAGSPDAPEVQAAVDTVTEASRAHTVALGAWVPSQERAQHFIDQGARYIALGSDLAMSADAVRAAFGDKAERSPRSAARSSNA